MLHERFKKLLASLDLDETTPPNPEQWAQTLAALERESRRADEMLSAVPDLIFTLSLEGRILDHKPARDWAPYLPPEQFLGRTVREVLPDPPASLICEALEEALTTNSIRLIEYELDGRNFEVRLTCESGEFAVAFVRDVTERRRFDESLRQAKEEAEKANRAKTQFLSNMSHELRTPLNAILGFSRVLTRGAYGDLTPRQQEYLRDIVQSGEHMLELVNNLLDLRRLEAGEDFLEPSTCSLAPIVDEAIAIVSSLVENKDLQLAVTMEADLPDVYVDHRAAVRTLVNLISNAVKYTDKGGLITVKATRQDRQARIEVSDSGIGIAPEDQQRIFDYFEQLQNGGPSSISGSGIGLALSRELVEQMGGAIGVHSQPGEGSCFYFTVPLSPLEGASRVAQSELDFGSSSPEESS